MKQISYPSIRQAFGILGLFIGVSIVTGLGLVALKSIPGMNNDPLIQFLGYILIMAFIIWFVRRSIKRQKTGDNLLFFNRINPVLYPFLLILTLSLAFLLDPLTNLIPMPEFMERLFEMLASRDIFTFLLVSLIGPVVEEVLFRGMILDGFLKRYAPGKAIFWSAFLFGIFHLNPWQFIPGFLIGLLLGWLYFKTRSLIPCFLIHIVNNTLSYLTMYFYGNDIKSFNDLFESATDYYMILGASGLIFAGGIAYLNRYYKGKSAFPETINIQQNGSSDQQ